MDVPRKRESKQQTNPPSDKRRKLRNPSSGLDGEYWRTSNRRRLPTRHPRVEPASAPLPPTFPDTSEDSETRTTEHNQLVVRQTFDVGLPIVFGQSSFPSPSRAVVQQLDQPFAALQRLGTVLNPEPTVLRAYEIEEPDSPRQSPYQRPLIAPTSVQSTNTAGTSPPAWTPCA
jgi:hypothetical protein